MNKTAMYIRLSKEDKKDKESESIINQRKLINNYILDNNLNYVEEYIDDGFTGTNFNRPGFEKLIKDIEDKKINCVIVKDLSRLGRNYIKSGYYVEEYFPLKKVRFISILDNIDTEKEYSLDIAPFKSILNDMISKDTSKKIRSILKVKKEQGLFLGTNAPFGYKKVNKYYLKPDAKTSSIVKKIFELKVSGYSKKEIVEYLNKNKVITPIMYINKKVNIRIKNPNIWSISSVNNILKNEVYIGTLIQSKHKRLSYKNSKKVIQNKENWIIKENNHEAIISKEVFIKANKIIRTRG